MSYLGHTKLRTILPEHDSMNHINNSHYLRYIEQGRIDILNRSSFYDLDKSVSGGDIFTIVSIEAKFLFPLLHSQDIEVRTYFIGFEELNGVFLQDIIQLKSGLTAFSAIVKWVVKDTNGSPKKLNKDVFSEMFEENVEIQEKRIREPLQAFYSDKIGRLEPEANNVFRHRLLSRYYEMDSYKKINNAVIFSYLEDGRWNFLSKSGLLEDDIFSDDTSLTLGTQLVHFKLPIIGNEELTICTEVKEITKASMIFRHILQDKNNIHRVDALCKVISINIKTGRPTAWGERLLSIIGKYYNG